MLVMKAFGLRGEVILPSFTFFATGHAVLWNGLDSRFCGLRSAELEHRSGRRGTSHHPADFGDIGRTSVRQSGADGANWSGSREKHGLKLVFDAAHAFGASYKGQPVGRFGDAEVFSLSPTKLLVAGEGGLICTNDAALAHRLRAGRNYGDLGSYNPDSAGAERPHDRVQRGDGADRPRPGCCQGSEAQPDRRAMYSSELDGTPGIAFQQLPPGHLSSYKDYSVRVDSETFGMTRDGLAGALLKENIETKRYFYPPLHQQALFRPFMPDVSANLSATEAVAESVLSLPIYESLPARDGTAGCVGHSRPVAMARAQGARAC